MINMAELWLSYGRVAGAPLWLTIDKLTSKPYKMYCINQLCGCRKNYNLTISIDIRAKI